MMRLPPSCYSLTWIIALDFILLEEKSPFPAARKGQLSFGILKWPPQWKLIIKLSRRSMGVNLSPPNSLSLRSFKICKISPQSKSPSFQEIPSSISSRSHFHVGCLQICCKSQRTDFSASNSKEFLQYNPGLDIWLRLQQGATPQAWQLWAG